MITALHGLRYSDDPPLTRAFLRDVLDYPPSYNLQLRLGHVDRDLHL
jgi:hypothetical protein